LELEVESKVISIHWNLNIHKESTCVIMLGYRSII
jgi:hypothetical protein